MNECGVRNTAGRGCEPEKASQATGKPIGEAENDIQTPSGVVPGGGESEVLDDRVRGLQLEVDRLQSAVHEEQMLRIREQATLQRDKDSYQTRVKSSLFQDLLSIVDSLGELVKHGENTQDDSSLLVGSRAILAQMIQLLARNGVHKLDGIEGNLYDSATSEIARVAPETETAANTVIRVLRDGYVMDGRLLRPAMVEVASAAPAEKTDDNTCQD